MIKYNIEVAHVEILCEIAISVASIEQSQSGHIAKLDVREN